MYSTSLNSNTSTVGFTTDIRTIRHLGTWQTARKTHPLPVHEASSPTERVKEQRRYVQSGKNKLIPQLLRYRRLILCGLRRCGHKWSGVWCSDISHVRSAQPVSAIDDVDEEQGTTVAVDTEAIAWWNALCFVLFWTSRRLALPLHSLVEQKVVAAALKEKRQTAIAESFKNQHAYCFPLQCTVPNLHFH